MGENSNATEPEEETEKATNKTGFHQVVLWRKAWRWIKKDTRSTEWLIVLFTAVLAVTSYFQWQVIRSGSTDTHTLADAAKKQADKAEAISAAVAKAADQMERSANQAENTAKQSGAQAKAAMDASNRQSKDALDAAIGSLQLDQRPWVYLPKYVLLNEPEEDKEITITIGIFNSGKTPAIDVSPRYQVFVGNTEPPETDFTKVNQDESHGLLPPGDTEISFKTAPLKVFGNFLSAYNSRVSYLYVHARIDYRDVFGVSHWTSLCIFHTHGRPLNEFDYCKSGNEADNNTKHPN
jgi:hypothetical protein